MDDGGSTSRDDLTRNASNSRARPSALRWLVTGSLVTGLLGAGALTLLVFAGAPEPVITGSALLGFSVGWTLLAVLSGPTTNQPQRWALVPGVVMAATGVALIVIAPGERQLTAAGWVWPPVLLGLALWIGYRVHRSLSAGSGRWPLYVVVLLMVAGAVGGMVETVGLLVDQHRYPMPGAAYDVGGHRLHLACAGSGGPTVVLISGLGEMSPYWSRIAPAVSARTRVCAYDRAGQGWSDASPRPQGPVETVDDLHTLLARAGEPGPYVLVGHSIGGTYALTYARRHPEEVAGTVLLDSADHYQASSTDASADTGADAVPTDAALAPSLSRLGVARLFPTSFWSGLPEPAAGQAAAFSTGPRGWRNVGAETASMPALFRQAQALTGLAGPLVVLTADESLDLPGWSSAQDRMCALSPACSHRVANTTHAGLLGDAHGAGISIGAINDTVQAVRTSSPR